MKKRRYLLFTIVVFFSLCKVYWAAVTPNGVRITSNNNGKQISLTCKYNSGKEFYLEREDQYDTELESNPETGENYGINDGYIIKNDTFLKGNDFLSQNGYFDCPLYATFNEDENHNIIYNGFTNTPPKDHFSALVKKESECAGACLVAQSGQTEENNSWVCKYKGPSGGTLTTENSMGVYHIFYPDGESEKVEAEDLSENCGDIFYNPHIGGDKPFYKMNSNLLKENDPEKLQEMYDFLCVNDSFMGEYYCEEGKECQFPENKNMTCQKIKDRLNNIKQGDNDSWICYYKGPSGETLTTENSAGIYHIFYPDGESEEVEAEDLSEICGDIFYNPHIGGDKPFYKMNYNLLVDNDSERLQEMYDFLCINDSFAGVYFCEEGKECRFPENKNITCQNIKDRLNGISTSPEVNLVFSDFCTNVNVKNTLRFIGYLLLIVRIIVPVILIIMGCIDFSKAVVASKEDNVQKALKTFALRCFIGLVIFVLPTIINFVFRTIVKSNVGYEECRVCIFNPGDCEHG